jgi:hypothetical protein
LQTYSQIYRTRPPLEVWSRHFSGFDGSGRAKGGATLIRTAGMLAACDDRGADLGGRGAGGKGAAAGEARGTAAAAVLSLSFGTK